MTPISIWQIIAMIPHLLVDCLRDVIKSRKYHKEIQSSIDNYDTYLGQYKELVGQEALVIIDNYEIFGYDTYQVNVCLPDHILNIYCDDENPYKYNIKLTYLNHRLESSATELRSIVGSLEAKKLAYSCNILEVMHVKSRDTLQRIKKDIASVIACYYPEIAQGMR